MAASENPKYVKLYNEHVIPIGFCEYETVESIVGDAFVKFYDEDGKLIGVSKEPVYTIAGTALGDDSHLIRKTREDAIAHPIIIIDKDEELNLGVHKNDVEELSSCRGASSIPNALITANQEECELTPEHIVKWIIPNDTWEDVSDEPYVVVYDGKIIGYVKFVLNNE